MRNSRDTPYVMFDDVYQGSGENLTQIAHEKHIDACYNKLSKVSLSFSDHILFDFHDFLDIATSAS